MFSVQQLQINVLLQDPSKFAAAAAVAAPAAVEAPKEEAKVEEEEEESDEDFGMGLFDQLLFGQTPVTESIINKEELEHVCLLNILGYQLQLLLL